MGRSYDESRSQSRFVLKQCIGDTGSHSDSRWKPDAP